MTTQAGKICFNALLLSLIITPVASQVQAQRATHQQPGYLNWYPSVYLSEEEQQGMMSFCSGAYRQSQITPIAGDYIEVEANESERDQNGDTHFSGNVEFRQHDRILTGDQASWFPASQSGFFSGNVRLQTSDITLYGDRAEVDEREQMQFTAAEYSIPARHLRGSADTIASEGDGKLKLQHATLTFCEPQSNDWDIAASELNLDQKRGIGSAWHARLRIADVPVMYLPYYRFPIGDQRTTGFLNPQFSINGQFQAEDIQLPFYLNLAPNLDATITPHHILNRGLLWESQLRHKTRWFGDGELNLGYLDSDRQQRQEFADFNAALPEGATNQKESDERYLINYQQQGQINQNWSHRWVYNKVSDKDYLSNMKPTAAVDRTTHLPRRGEILFNQTDWHFDITAESFQTVDETIALKNRPYRRLPQLNLNYTPSVINDWQLEQELQYTRFTRDDSAKINNADVELVGFDALNGRRWLSDSAVSYPFEWPFGFLTPKAEYRHRQYQLTDADETISQDEATELNIRHGVGRYSLDAGVYFDREFNWFGSDYQQTLEPRVFWVKSPYLAGQENIPNFDTTVSTVSFSSLFTGERFSGGDRLADLDQTSIGLTTRIIRDDGLEQFRLSLGQIQYNEDRRVQLTETATLDVADTQSTSSTLAEVEWNPDEKWSLYHTLEWDPFEDYAKQRRYGVRFEGVDNRFLSASTNAVQTYDAENDRFETKTKQLDWGFFWSLNDRWALVGRQLRDLRSYKDEAKRPVSDVLESIAGLEYQNCCWRVQLLYRESSPKESDTESDFTTDKKYGFMLSIQLKGLTTLGGGTDALIEDAVTGYSRRKYHDF
ncbi:MAG: LPS assembly protein LptD [Saccharospirillaceae bacterium]|nr:LPS assembly protein LptD [Saccharospirillaceae bacterium]